ncbi:hypothetical protein AX16_008144 [Volvariella volvacea WC 439]|nr:hypothetical protein AX16_008144 [Volvariella volvacea WC 439]
MSDVHHRQSASAVPKTTSSVHDVSEDQPAFGCRFLTDETQVFTQNAWDHVPFPVEQIPTIRASLERQRQAPVPADEKYKYNEKPARHWDNFYKMNAANFFRNRKWLHNEFPELVAASQFEAGPMIVAEVGCGAGNSVFPLLSSNRNPSLVIKAYDYSSHAVKLVQHNPLYLAPPAGSISASVWDVTSSAGIPSDLEPCSVDIIILVFVLSALHPDEWGRAINNMHKMLKPGGLIVLRDYGRHDLTQLRFKSGRMLDENFYIRGDKTRVYFFDIDELALLFTGSRAPGKIDITTTEEASEEPLIDGLQASAPQSSSRTPTVQQVAVPSPVVADDSTSAAESSNTLPNPLAEQSLDLLNDTESAAQEQEQDAMLNMASATETEEVAHLATIIHPNALGPLERCPPHPLFTSEQLGIDRRLLVNRKRQLKMYRVWVQAKFKKVEGEGGICI